MKVKLVYLGILEKRRGLREEAIQCPTNASIEDLLTLLKEKHPSLFEGLEDRLLFAVNNEYVSPEQQLSEDDEIALMPPLGGGSSFSFEITDDPIPSSLSFDYHPECGANIVFDGSIRDLHENQKIESLTYDIYEPMASQKFSQLLKEVEQKFPQIKRMHIIHRIGEIKVREVALRVIIQSPHRQEAIEGLNYTINRIKEIVPIFKVSE